MTILNYLLFLILFLFLSFLKVKSLAGHLQSEFIKKILFSVPPIRRFLNYKRPELTVDRKARKVCATFSFYLMRSLTI